MPNYSGPIFPKGGSEVGKTVLPSEKQISDGHVDGKVDLSNLWFLGTKPTPGNVLERALDKLDKYVGWVYPFNDARKGGEKPIKPPPVPNGFEGRPYKSRNLDYKTGYEKLRQTAENHGYNIIEEVGNVLQYNFGNRKGYETGKNIYVASDLSFEEKSEVLVHELLAKLMGEETGIAHNDLHKFLIPVQKTVADAIAA